MVIQWNEFLSLPTYTQRGLIHIRHLARHESLTSVSDELDHYVAVTQNTKEAPSQILHQIFSHISKLNFGMARQFIWLQQLLGCITGPMIHVELSLAEEQFSYHRNVFNWLNLVIMLL